MKKTILSLLVLCFLFCFSKTVLGNGFEKMDGEGLIISPFLKELELENDQQEASFNLEIENKTSASVKIMLSALDYSSLNDSTGLLEMNSGNKWERKYGLASWIKIDRSEIDVEAGTKNQIRIKVINDDKLSPGGHYGLILLEIKNIDNNDSDLVKINSKMTALVFLRKKGGEIHNFSLKKEEYQHQLWSFPQKISFYFENLGNVHVVPRGLVEIEDPLGRKILRGIINKESKIILPESKIALTSNLDEIAPAFLPGKYKLVFQYRRDGADKLERSEKTLFFLPKYIFLTIIIVALFFVYRMRAFFGRIFQTFIRFLRMKIKRRKRRISIKKRNKLKMEKRVVFEARNSTEEDSREMIKNEIKEEIKREIREEAIKKLEKRSLAPGAVIWLLFFVLAGLIVFLGYQFFLKKPVTGEIKKMEQKTTEVPEKPALEKFQGEYIIFEHNSLYRENFHKRNVSENKNILEQALFSQADANKKIAVTVENMSGSGLSDVASYNLRKKFPQRYKEGKEVLSGLTMITFISRENDTFEKTNFLLKGNYLIEISFSSSLSEEIEIEKEIQAILQTIQFKK